jgi:fructose-1,6-bisphosphatase I
MIMENAEGAATDGRMPILDIVPTTLHQNCPLVFGSADEVRRVAGAYAADVPAEPPLFKSRSLFRKSITTGGTIA